ncbi:hypothetical protein HAX54_048750, partial [Datura stramonium]|nr:hypothetical protein [Datura stramonium]
VVMNPSKFQKYEMGSFSKIAKPEFIQPGTLAKGRGHNVKVIGSLRVNAEQRTLISKIKVLIQQLLS